MMQVKFFRTPMYFCFNSGPKWDAIVHYGKYGIVVRHEFTRIRVCLIIYQIIIFIDSEG